MGINEAVKFLCHVYNGSVTDVANIQVAQAEGNVEVIKGYLNTVAEYAKKLNEAINILNEM